MLQNHFPENRVEKNFFGPKFFKVAKSFPRKQVCKKDILRNFFSEKNFLDENFLRLQNHFLENRFEGKNV